ncbi:hypothetical protein [Treponema phagedenis]|uniref:hypothetical protein n=1 Tax=Treponema phagedenis TaxID=162 RepID=UPI00046598EC|nr:hypothetical protein [Treponema phagedenis]NVP22721.1 hypothetical protein [Treponema phagedenis]NVP23230.1 hypothetical protein [Treponema phagedenis]QEJ95329.1 hypothetical protein FUT79_09015 [Treponema phagedenis]QEK01181.1 hypothetical protein FUT84_08480 [Treponema phagedenis]QEK06192.1 hypothetical protein FUT80_05385 [Treponema phagedenis]
MVLKNFGREHKKKLGNIDFERIGRNAKQWKIRPSSYFKNLNDYEAFVVDEACIVALELDNRYQARLKKENEEEKKKKQEEEKRQKQFNAEMDKYFAEEGDEY